MTLRMKTPHLQFWLAGIHSLLVRGDIKPASGTDQIRIYILDLHHRRFLISAGFVPRQARLICGDMVRGCAGIIELNMGALGKTYPAYLLVLP